MKKLNLAASVVGVVSMLGATTPAFASAWDAGLVANVPFAFTVGHMTLPPGTYTVRRTSNVAGEVYEIRSKDSKDEALFTAIESELPARRGGPDELVFTEAGDRYFLSEIDAKADGAMLDLARPKAERRLLAQGTTVTIDTKAASPTGD